jgi:hypothetical protein
MVRDALKVILRALPQSTPLVTSHSKGVPVYKDIDARTTYGVERVNNADLVEGARRTNQLMMLELRYRY